jgi:glycosyltransferase involved in cell wall biosynthesis
MVKRVLMIAYHYPPIRGSSGIQRTLKFSQYLPEAGWEPIVLTAHPRSYQDTSYDQMKDIPDHIKIHQAFALDTSLHLSIGGRYPGFLALPDRWISWWLGAVPAGLSLIRQYRPDVIWSTYPIATAHVIGHTLHRLTGIPWVADFRDPMTDTDYPVDPATRAAYLKIEKKTVDHCSRIVCTTPGAIRQYQHAFPSIPASRFCLIENGYDEENFSSAETLQTGTKKSVQPEEPVLLVHSGIIYPSERDPVVFFQAISDLMQAGAVTPANFRVILRATSHDHYLRPLIDRYGIGEIVSLAPPVPYREALSEMMHASGLLILQASSCNNQIPAKLYEYLRAGRPVLALTDPTGDTARTLMAAGIDTIARLDSKDDIKEALLRFIALVRQNQAPLAQTEKIRACSRQSRTRELAELLDTVTQGL